MRPTISVCMPIHNGARYLQRTLESLTGQEDSNWEAVVCDDASTDGSLDILGRQVGNDRRFRTFRNGRRLGLFENPAQCLRRAEGEYVLFLPQDDQLLPGALAAFAESLDRNHEAALAFASVQIIDARERLQRTLVPMNPDMTWVPPLGYLKSIARGGDLILWVASMARRRHLEQIGTFAPNLPITGDLELWLRLNLRFPFVRVDQTLAAYRHHADGASGMGQVSPEAIVLEAHRMFESLLEKTPLSRGERELMRRRLLDRIAIEALDTSRLIEGYERHGCRGMQRLIQALRKIGCKPRGNRWRFVQNVFVQALHPLPELTARAIRLFHHVNP